MPYFDPQASIASNTSIPSTTIPNATWWLLSHGVATYIITIARKRQTVVMKNCDPFVSFPALAIDKIPFLS